MNNTLESHTRSDQVTVLEGMSDAYPITRGIPRVYSCLSDHYQSNWENACAVGIGTSGAAMLTVTKLIYPRITPVLLKKPGERTHKGDHVDIPPTGPIIIVDDQVTTYSTMRTIARMIQDRVSRVVGVVAYGAYPDRILEIFPNVKVIIQ